VIDCHTHIGAPEHVTDAFLEDARRSWGQDFVFPASLEDHLHATSVVRRAIVLGFRAGATGFVVPNDYVAAYVSRHLDRFVGFAGIDLAEEGAVDEIERCAQDLGLRGLKIGPTYQGIHPLDERALPVYERAQSLGLPIMWHQGTTFVRNAQLSAAQPTTIDEVASRYPDLRIVIAHMGHPWVLDCVVVVRKHPNVFADVSALHPRPWQLYNALRAAIEYRVWPKLLFGSDFPFFTPTETAAGLRAVADVWRTASLPPIDDELVEELIERDGLALIGIE
jgi:predicted TIM-barrel fold metal-dependent hydrolase